jgi:hypothetical protein
MPLPSAGFGIGDDVLFLGRDLHGRRLINAADHHQRSYLKRQRAADALRGVGQEVGWRSKWDDLRRGSAAAFTSLRRSVVIVPLTSEWRMLPPARQGSGMIELARNALI